MAGLLLEPTGRRDRQLRPVRERAAQVSNHLRDGPLASAFHEVVVGSVEGVPEVGGGALAAGSSWVGRLRVVSVARVVAGWRSRTPASVHGKAGLPAGAGGQGGRG